MRQLDVVIDSLQKQVNILRKRLTNDMYRSQQFVQYLDSSWDVAGTKNFKPVKNFDEILPDSARQLVKERAVSEINSLRVAMDVTGNDLREKEKILELHEIEWHRKISLSLACLVLFLIGAPLGSIIRKGGLGTPLVFAIIFFMLFYFSSNTGEKFAREGSVSAFTGMWMATFVLVPIGIFLTYKAMQDSQLFNKEFYYRIAKFIASLFRKTDRSSTGL
jgi:lipopolysaccharide export system permease protein